MLLSEDEDSMVFAAISELLDINSFAFASVILSPL